MLYGRDEGQPCVVTAKAAKLIRGRRIGSRRRLGAAGLPRRELSHLLPRMAKAYALSRWPLDWAIGYVTGLWLKGRRAGYGAKHLSYSVVYPDAVWRARARLTSGPGGLRRFRRLPETELSSSTGAKFSAPSFSMTREHEVTKTSSDGVFHGSSSRS